MPSSPLPQSVRGEHERTLHGLVGRLEKRLAEIESRLRDACDQRADMRPVFQETWKPRFEALKKTVYHLRRLVSARQSLFVMGKRGQGKTTLLRSWVGKGITAPVGREPLPLPTGMEETTCSLVRLTASATNADYLQVDLLPADSLLSVEPRPDRPQLDRLTLSRTVSKGIDPESPFFVVRYPVKNKDEKLRCAADGPHYNLGETGEIALTSLQYYASEVAVPLQLAGLRGHARLLLDALDVVDAPGADPAAKGEYAEWVRHKNRAVIHQGMDRLDLLESGEKRCGGASLYLSEVPARAQDERGHRQG